MVHCISPSYHGWQHRMWLFSVYFERNKAKCAAATESQSLSYLSDRCCSGCGLRARKSLLGLSSVRIVRIGCQGGGTDWTFFPCCVGQTERFFLWWWQLVPYSRQHSGDREDFKPTWRDSEWNHDGAKWHSWETRWVGVAHSFITPGLTW